MIVETSALVAILRNEESAERLVDVILDSGDPWMSAASYLETGIVIDAGNDPVASRRVDQVRDDLGIAVAPVTLAQAELARQAYRDFGKGSGHPAQLNFGDCFAYALARSEDRPLLFVGDDFTHTDIEPVLST